MFPNFISTLKFVCSFITYLIKLVDMPKIFKFSSMTLCCATLHAFTRSMNTAHMLCPFSVYLAESISRERDALPSVPGAAYCAVPVGCQAALRALPRRPTTPAGEHLSLGFRGQVRRTPLRWSSATRGRSRISCPVSVSSPPK